jgi:hypothetical protein
MDVLQPTTSSPLAAKSGILPGLGKRTDELEAEAQALPSKIADIETEGAERKAVLERQVDGLKPPVLQTPPPPQPQMTDPKKVWASQAMALAAIGAAFTRTPLTTAMNAAAGVINAYHQGDKEKADAAYKTWQVANENAIKNANFQAETYKAILSQLGTQERAIDAETSRQERAVIEEFRAHQAAFGTETRAMIQSIADGQRLAISLERLAHSMEMSTPKMEEEKAFQDALIEMKQSDTYQKADPITKAKMVFGLRHELAPSQASVQGGGSPKDMAAARQVYKVEFPTDPVSGQPKTHKDAKGRQQDAPDFEQWYEHDWADWGKGAHQAALPPAPPPKPPAPGQAPKPPAAAKPPATSDVAGAVAELNRLHPARGLAEGTTAHKGNLKFVVHNGQWVAG